VRSAPPIRLGIAIFVAYLVCHWTFDGVVELFWGFPATEQPAWRSDLWWPDLVNAALIGFIPAALRFTRIGIERDLESLHPRMSGSDAELSALREEFTGPGGWSTRAASLSGISIGIGLTYLDPSISHAAERSLSDPLFLWALLRTSIFVWLVMHLINTDFRTTRLYFLLGRDHMIVDLLDDHSLAPLAQRGQRSVLTWALFSSLFSLFWLGDSAAQANVILLVLALMVATIAYFVPLQAVRKKILAAKQLELDRLRAEIRIESRSLNTESEEARDTSPRLANLVSYYQLIDAASEWPIDATNIVRLALYLVLGVGSWLGAAFVERLVDGILSG